MIRFFPLDNDEYTLTMNARATQEARVDVEPEHYAAELALKADILASDYGYYFQCPPDAEPSAWEAIAVLLPEMAARYPQWFRLRVDGERWQWTNRLLETEITFRYGDAGSLPLSPLDWLARQMQEDLILMGIQSVERQALSIKQEGSTPNPHHSSLVCIAGHLCFGAGWCLGDKMGKSLLAIHEPVPFFAEQIGRPSDLMIQRLKPERPTMRLNWSIASTNQLNLAPKLASEWTKSRQMVTPENAGIHCFWRIERQTFTRLPETGAILFTIHTYLNSIAELAADTGRRRRLASVLRALPPETAAYKGMTDYLPALLAYLDAA